MTEKKIDIVNTGIIESVFAFIENANSLKDLEINKLKCGSIEFEQYIIDKPFDRNIYPKINYSINQIEIEKLKQIGILNVDDNDILKIEINESSTTLEKLFYSMIWKNGDIQKLKSIINGIVQDDKEIPSLVFKQFGRFLATVDEPIIDQHVIRAYIASGKYEEKIPKNTSLYNANNETIKIVDSYKEYILEQAKRIDKGSLRNTLIVVDEILFLLGKYLKSKGYKY